MKILHAADPHLDDATSENVDHALEQLLRLAKRELGRNDRIVIAGDLGMKRGSLKPWVIERLRGWHADMARICDVVVVAGNHDLSHSWDEVGTVGAVLSRVHSEYFVEYHERPYAATGWAYLPYPSRYALQSTNGNIPASEINAHLSDLLLKVVRGLAAEAGPGSLLVFHGSIEGAKTGDERGISADLDTVLREADIPPEFEAVLCGHIHRYQQIGRAVYAGSPCPLNFSEESYAHGAVIWERSSAGASWSHRFVELEPKHRLWTLDMREHGLAALPAGLEGGKARDARLRVLLTLPRGASASEAIAKAEMHARAAGAFEVKVQIEREAESRAITVTDGVRVNASLDSLLDAYAERNPDARGALPALKELAAEIDSKLPPDAFADARLGDYQLLRLSWSNWKSFGVGPFTLDLSELGRLVCVAGENASGKSNLMEVESFALWGRLPRGKVALGDLVRIGETDAYVEAEFLSGGCGYKARRTLKVNAKGIGVGDLILQGVCGEGDMWEPLNAGTARETQERIESLVGPFELYLATRYASQGDIDRLLEMTPGELKDVLQQAIGTGIFGYREAAARVLLNESDIARAALQSTEDSLRSLSGDLVGLTSAQHYAWVCENAANLERATASDAKRLAEAACSHAETEIQRLEIEAEATNQKRARIIALSSRIGGMKDLAAVATAKVASGQSATEALAGFAEVEAELVQLDAASAAGQRAKADHLAAIEAHDALAHQLKEDRARLRRESESKVEAHRASKAAIEAHAEEFARHELAYEVAHEQRVTAIQRSVARAKKSADTIGKAPFREKCIDAHCPLLGSAAEDRDSIPALEKEAQDAQADHATRKQAREAQHHAEVEQLAAAISAAERAIHECGAQREAFEEDAARRIGEAMQRVQAAEAEFRATAFDPERMKQLRDLLATKNETALREDIRRGDEARGSLEVAERRISELATEIAALEAEIREAGDGRLAEANSVLARCRDDLAASRESLAAAEKRVAECRQILATADARLAQAKASLARADQAKAERDALLPRLDGLGILARAFGRDGLPFLLLERAIPTLEEYANGFLGDDELRLEIDPVRDLRSGEQKTEANVRFRDRFGAHPLSAASGAQRVKLGYALRAALSRVQADALGMRVSHWIADEGWGAFDETNLLHGQQMLRRLAEAFDRVIYVSHQGPISEVADSRITVIADERDGSRIEVAA